MFIIKKQELIELLKEMPDNRKGNAIKHNLSDILMIGILCIICSGETFTDMQIFGETHQHILEQFLDLPNGIPSHDTFCDVFSKLDPKKLSIIFSKWISQIRKDVNKYSIVSIDGKTIRRSRSRDKKAKHIVTAFASDLQLVLGQLATDEKSNEITAIPQLLEMFGLKNKIVTIDAMGTQTAIAEKIIEKGGDYILSLKSNQPTLYEDVRLYFDEYINKPGIKESELYSKTFDKGHGRIEKRECWICNEIDWLYGKEKWAGINGIGVIKSEVGKMGEKSVQYHYFIYSAEKLTARELMKIKRSHWAIENSLHWVLDMTFREDENRARTENAAENLNILRKQAMSLLKTDKKIKGSMRAKRLICGYDIFTALNILGIDDFS